MGLFNTNIEKSVKTEVIDSSEVMESTYIESDNEIDITFYENDIDLLEAVYMESLFKTDPEIKQLKTKVKELIKKYNKESNKGKSIGSKLASSLTGNNYYNIMDSVIKDIGAKLVARSEITGDYYQMNNIIIYKNYVLNLIYQGGNSAIIMVMYDADSCDIPFNLVKDALIVTRRIASGKFKKNKVTIVGTASDRDVDSLNNKYGDKYIIKHGIMGVIITSKK